MILYGNFKIGSAFYCSIVGNNHAQRTFDFSFHAMIPAAGILINPFPASFNSWPANADSCRKLNSASSKASFRSLADNFPRDLCFSKTCLPLPWYTLSITLVNLSIYSFICLLLFKKFSFFVLILTSKIMGLQHWSEFGQCAHSFVYSRTTDRLIKSACLLNNHIFNNSFVS